MNICIEKQKEIDEVYKKFRNDIDEAIKGYASTIDYEEKDYFAEIAFCILTPQSKARNAWSAIEKLKTNGLLYTGNERDIVEYLNVVRFKNNKANNKYNITKICLFSSFYFYSFLIFILF